MQRRCHATKNHVRALIASFLQSYALHSFKNTSYALRRASLERFAQGSAAVLCGRYAGDAAVGDWGEWEREIRRAVFGKRQDLTPMGSMGSHDPDGLDTDGCPSPDPNGDARLGCV